MTGTVGAEDRDSRAICYSGYRQGQSPDAEIFPTETQIAEDLGILQRNWRHLRLYDCSTHARRTLEVIRRRGLDFRVMLGAYLAAERSNPGCPWGGGTYIEAQLRDNEQHNRAEIERLIELARHYDDIVDAVAVGNECTVDWTDHLVPLERMIGYVRRVKQAVAQPVTFCENYVPWQHQLRDLAQELDFLSLHTYPVWEYKSVHEALAYTRDNVDSVARRYPGKGIVVSEAGWTTGSSGRGIPPGHVSQETQALHYRDLMAWSRESGMRVYVFEAFDEPWKGSPDPLEPEKHWGLFTVDRRPKLVMRSLYPELVEPVPA
jgi:exo-beta-1,3-glucanase (GH17 family)